MHKELDHFNSLIRNARRYLKYAELKEADLLLAMAALKQAMPWELRRYCTYLANGGTVPACLRALDDLEKFVHTESKQLMGKSYVIQEALEAKRQTVEKCCLNDMRLALEYAAEHKPTFLEAQDEARRREHLAAGPKPPNEGRWSS